MKFLVQHFIEQTFQERSSQIAIEQGHLQYTYSDIECLSNRYATVLIGLGLKKGQQIGVLSRVRFETIAAMIACLRLGIVYVPLNIHAPSSWIGNVVRKSGLKYALIDPLFMNRFPDLKEYGLQKAILLGDSDTTDFSCDIISFKDVGAADAVRPAQVPLLAEDLAWILYTSGSTGDPKGIMITHRNAYTFIDWMRNEFDVRDSDRVFSRAPLQFDLSVFDIFTTFQAGATLVIAPLDFENRPEGIVNLMRDSRITIVYTVPSAYISWLTKGNLAKGIPTLRCLLYAGEPFPTPYLRQVMHCLPGTIVSNIYGPTETNIVTFHHLREPPATDDPIPIGRPVHDTEVYIVDENLNQVDNGEVGEILIRGGTVFAGYFGNPELTAKRLVQSPFHNYPTLCCRTGDYGRILPTGEIAYHGRMDNMVKTRGYRVEIGEVEAAFASLGYIDEVAVVTQPHERYGQTLHAYAVLKSNERNEAMVMADIGEMIPSYMIPMTLSLRSELPKTATGKVDRVGLTKQLRG